MYPLISDISLIQKANPLPLGGLGWGSKLNAGTEFKLSVRLAFYPHPHLPPARGKGQK
jgi:hypothetical protein